MDGVLVGRMIFAAMALAGLALFLWVRPKPPEWVPPSWARWGAIATVDRDAMLLNAGLTLGGGVAFLVASLVWLD
ncbi:MAG TPA: hypothetical protein VMY88_11225 [Acidimicrobiales bacterium]|nr:hypothetical protein [Acidimicrobiales bacterium]